MVNRLLKPNEVDIIFRYPNGRTQRLAKAGKIPFIELPDGEMRIDERDIESLLACKIAAELKESDNG
jgi:hypothetical protein